MKNKRIICNDSQISFIKENYPNNGSKYCSDNLKIPIGLVRRMAYKLGLRITQELKIKNAGMGWEYNYKDKQLKEYGRFLSNLNNPKLIYFLGFLWGDGNVEKNHNELGIVINETDGLNLKNIFLDVLPFRVKIYESYRYEVKTQNQIQFKYINKFICDFLIENDYHIKSGSSADKILSKIPEHLQHYWWRGYSDADGCFMYNPPKRKRLFSITSVYNQDWSFRKSLENKIGVEFKISKTIGKNGKASRINLYKIGAIKKLGEYIYQNYKNDKIGLNRKYQKFLTINFKPIISVKNDVNKVTGLIRVYKCGPNSYRTRIRKLDTEYCYESTNKDKVIEIGDRLTLFLWPENGKLNFPERKNIYIEMNNIENPTTVVLHYKLKNKIIEKSKIRGLI